MPKAWTHAGSTETRQVLNFCLGPESFDNDETTQCPVDLSMQEPYREKDPFYSCDGGKATGARHAVAKAIVFRTM